MIDKLDNEWSITDDLIIKNLKLLPCEEKRATAFTKRLPQWVEALERLDILESVLEYKRAFFNASYANYDACENGKVRLLPSSENLKALSKDYDRMIDADMFYQKLPVFTDIIDTLQSLESKINKKVLAVS